MFYMGSLMIALAVEESGTKKTANNMNMIILCFLTGFTRYLFKIKCHQSITFFVTITENV